MPPDAITPDETVRTEVILAEAVEDAGVEINVGILARLDAIDARLAELAVSDRAVHADLVEPDASGSEAGVAAGPTGPAELVEDENVPSADAERSIPAAGAEPERRDRIRPRERHAWWRPIGG